MTNEWRARRIRHRVLRLGALASTLLLTGCGVGLSPAPAGDPFGPPPGTSPAPAAPTALSTPSPRTDRPGRAPRVEPTPTSRPSPEPSTTSSPPTTKKPLKTNREAGGAGPWVGTFQGHRVKVPRGHGARVSFTFDDGPSPRFTPQVLALLEQHHTPAVFCVIGRRARAHSKLVREEIKAGHLVCDHSRDHDLSMNRRGQAYVDAEVSDGLAAIHAASPGTRVRYYRQPGGLWSAQVTRAMRQSDLTPLRWDVDPRDWSRPGADAVVRRVVAQLHPGAIILMHDGGGDRTQTVEALRWLLDALTAAGWVPALPPHH